MHKVKIHQMNWTMIIIKRRVWSKIMHIFCTVPLSVFETFSWKAWMPALIDVWWNLSLVCMVSKFWMAILMLSFANLVSFWRSRSESEMYRKSVLKSCNPFVTPVKLHWQECSSMAVDWLLITCFNCSFSICNKVTLFSNCSFNMFCSVFACIWSFFMFSKSSFSSVTVLSNSNLSKVSCIRIICNNFRVASLPCVSIGTAGVVVTVDLDRVRKSVKLLWKVIFKLLPDDPKTKIVLIKHDQWKTFLIFKYPQTHTNRFKSVNILNKPSSSLTPKCSVVFNVIDFIYIDNNNIDAVILNLCIFT